MSDLRDSHQLRLEDIQHWLQKRISKDYSAQSGDLESQGTFCPELLINSSEQLGAADRLAIYQRSYSTRLINCFRSLFPSLLHALGKDLFDHFALDFLSHYPPKNYSLNQIADHFPRHLADTRPDAEKHPENRDSWPDFIVELATLEQTFMEIYNGLGVEKLRNFQLSDLGKFDFEHFSDVRVKGAPCLRLFQFRYPVHEYFKSTRSGEQPKLPRAKNSFVLMCRQKYQVVVRELSGEEFHLLSSVLAKTPSKINKDVKALLRSYLRNWIEQRYLILDL